LNYCLASAPNSVICGTHSNLARNSTVGDRVCDSRYDLPRLGALSLINADNPTPRNSHFIEIAVIFAIRFRPRVLDGSRTNNVLLSKITHELHQHWTNLDWHRAWLNSLVQAEKLAIRGRKGQPGCIGWESASSVSIHNIASLQWSLSLIVAE
jgi:hypothetical protein